MEINCINYIFTNILTIYESLDYMLNDKVDIVNSNSGELWD